MTVFQLAQALLRQYPPDARVVVVKPIPAVSDIGEYTEWAPSTVTELLLDETNNTVELIAD